MRRLILLAIFSVLILRGSAEGQQSVLALERLLTGGGQAELPGASSPDEMKADTDLIQQLQQDTNLAGQIDGLELSERLTQSRIENFVMTYRLGPQTKQALEQLADRSALLEIPENEPAHRPPPDEDTQ